MMSSTADFFFSSRRRHTRWTGDWSSDVCSSDLFPVDVGDLSVDAGAGGPPVAGGELVDRGGPVQPGVGRELVGEAAVGAVEGDAQAVVLHAGDHPTAECGQQHHGDDPEAALMAGRWGGAWGCDGGGVGVEQAVGEAAVGAVEGD